MATQTPLLIQTKAFLESNRAVLTATRYLIARNRRKLNPAFGVSGGAVGPPARDTVRALLVSGILAPASNRVMAGLGNGKRLCLRVP
jgi:hypothetical protein